MFGATITPATTLQISYGEILLRIFPPPSTIAVVDPPVNNDTSHPQPIKTAPDPAFVQELNNFRADFDAFYNEFAKFRDTVLQLPFRPMIPAPSAPPASTTMMITQQPCGSALFQKVIGELDTVNLQFSQLLDQFEKRNHAPHLHPLSDLSNNPQQLEKNQNLPIPCVYGIVLPAPIPEQPTAALSKSPRDSHSLLTITHQVTNMVEPDDRTFVLLPPPAPDPVDMVFTGALWPQPHPAQKTIPFKKKAQTKPTVVRCRNQDLRPP